jgi:pantothenate kinase
MTVAGGYAWRRRVEDSVIVAATLGYGIVHVRSPWVLSTTVYVAFRHSATGPSRDEFTAGLSFGGGVLYGVTSIVTGDHG